jgi:Cu2+-exporting ATPase
MILEATTLSGVLWVGYKNWRKQENEYNSNILLKQKSASQNKILGSEKKLTLCSRLSGVNKQPTVIVKQAVTSVPDKALVRQAIALSVATVAGLLPLPFTYVGIPFLLYAMKNMLIFSVKSLREGKIEVETILSVGIIGAIFHDRLFFASSLGLLFRLSDFLTDKVIQESHKNLVGAFEQVPKSVWLLIDGAEVAVALATVKSGDILVVNAGEVIPVDGCIVQGMAGIDQHRLTGESIPIEKGEGEKVFAMTLVLSGKIHIKVDKAGSETSAMKIAEILENTTDYKSLTTLRAEKFSRQMVNPAVITAVAALPLLGSSAAIAVLFIHPNKRLSVTAPISLLKYLKYAADQSVLIKDGRSLELLSQVDTVVFDKTGTLTEEQPCIGTIHTLLNYTQHEVLRYAAIAEFKQPHPLAKAILYEAEQRGVVLTMPDQTEYKLGYGVKVIMNNQTILVGSLRFMESEKVVISDDVQQIQQEAKEKGYGLVMVSVDNNLVGVIELLPSLRSETKHVIEQLRSNRKIKEIYIISGDAEAPTRQLADELGVSYFAETLPHEKSALIEQLQQQGKFVCYVGDGINDAIAMKQAQISVSLSGASQVATDTAQVVLLDRGIAHLPLLFEIASGINTHMNNQIAATLGVSIVGVSGIFLLGWGIAPIMILNMISLLATLGYSLIDKPKCLSAGESFALDEK